MHTHRPLRPISPRAVALAAVLALVGVAAPGAAQPTPDAGVGPAASDPGPTDPGAAAAATTGADDPDADGDVLDLRAPPGDGDLLSGSAPAAGEISYENPLVGYVVVTGSRRRQRDASALATVSILRRDVIAAVPYFFLGDLLALIPGVDARWGMMQRYYVGIRGLGSTTALNSRLLLLWDGVPMNDPFTGELSAGHFLPLVDVDRVEVIRGAGSTMYGANAFSGVVNVVTRDPIDLEPEEGVHARAGLGSDMTSRLQLGGDQQVGPVHVGASVESFQTDGPFPLVERATPTGPDVFKNDDVRSLAAETHLGWKGVQVRAQLVTGERGKPGTFITDSQGLARSCATCHSTTESGRGEKYPATPHSCGTCHAAPHDREDTTRGGVAVSVNRWLGSGYRLGAQLYDNEYRSHFTSTKESDFLGLYTEELDLAQRAAGGGINLGRSSARNHFLVGTELRYTAAASQLLATPAGASDASMLNQAAYLEDELHPRPWLALVVGARGDYSEDFGFAFSPRGGVVVKPAEHVNLRLGASRAFRNPSLSELYVAERRGRYQVAGNPELAPEWITSFELGANAAFEVGQLMLRVSSVTFLNRTTDLIGIEATSRDRATFVNQDAATVWGEEVELESELATRPVVRLSANYSYQHAVDADGERLSYAPRSKGNVLLMVRWDHAALLVRGRIAGPRRDEMQVDLPTYATLDVAARTALGSGLGLELSATNLSGDDHPESLGIPRRARSFFASLTYGK